MSDILNKTIVLVLNRNWQAINIRTPADAFCQMATNVATALEIDGENHIRPMTWEEWITLPIRDGDNAVNTVRGAIRAPTVIVQSTLPKYRRGGRGSVRRRFASAMAIVASTRANGCASTKEASIMSCPVRAAAR